MSTGAPGGDVGQRLQLGDLSRQCAGSGSRPRAHQLVDVGLLRLAGAGILGARQLLDAGKLHLVVMLASACSWSSWRRQRRPVRITAAC